MAILKTLWIVIALLCSCTLPASAVNSSDSKVVYCGFSYAIPAGVLLFFIWWLFLFTALAVTADNFFSPSLTVIAKVCRMSDNIAGVTLLAFGNGAPDIFSAISAIGSVKNGDAGLAFGALLGAGVFVTAVVSGAVIIASPFQCMERPLLRDISFYLAALFYTFYIMHQREIYTWQAIVFLLIYVLYVAVVIISRYIRKRFSSQPFHRLVSSNVEPGVQRIDADPDMPSTFSKHLAEEAAHDGEEKLHHRHHHKSNQPAEASPNNSLDDDYNDGVEFHGIANINNISNIDTVQQNASYSDEETPLLKSDQENDPISLWTSFLDAINPVCKEDWHSRRWYGKAYLIWKAPIQVILTLTCPVVDYDSENDNWNRLLSAVQLVLGSLFMIFATAQYNVKIGGVFPVWAVVLIVSLVIAIVVFYVSQTRDPPVLHSAFAFLGFIVAVVWIYSIANEIVNLLQLFGVALNISDAILGLTLLAWGNSIGDLIADTSLARKGYPRIGISACFSGPLFNLLMGIGIPFTIGCLKSDSGVFTLGFDFLQLVLTGGLLCSLLSTFIIAPMVLKFYMKRWFGVYLICLYLCLLLWPSWQKQMLYRLTYQISELDFEKPRTLFYNNNLL